MFWEDHRVRRAQSHASALAVVLFWQPFDLIVDSNKIYVPYGAALVGEVSPATHKLLWTFGPKFSPIAEEFIAAPALDSGHIYLASDKHIYSLTRP
jgi:hypothetical protein